MSDINGHIEPATEIPPILEPVVEQVQETDNISTPKKRRGRPPKNAVLEDQAVNGAEKPKRTYTKKTDRVTFDSDSTRKLAKQLEGIHLMIASMTKLNELCISDTESMALAQSLQTMSVEYNISIDGKMGAIIGLTATSAMIYVPRFIVINARIKKAQQAARNANIIEAGDINAGG